MILIRLIILLMPLAVSPAAHPVFEAGPVQVRAGAKLKPSERVDELVFSHQDELGIKRANL